MFECPKKLAYCEGTLAVVHMVCVKAYTKDRSNKASEPSQSPDDRSFYSCTVYRQTDACSPMILAKATVEACKKIGDKTGRATLHLRKHIIVQLFTQTERSNDDDDSVSPQHWAFLSHEGGA